MGVTGAVVDVSLTNGALSSDSMEVADTAIAGTSAAEEATASGDSELSGITESSPSEASDGAMRSGEGMRVPARRTAEPCISLLLPFPLALGGSLAVCTLGLNSSTKPALSSTLNGGLLR